MKKPISKLGTAIILGVTVILAGVAIFTAFRLYQLRQEAVAPNVPSSNPKADEATATPANYCQLSFTISTSTSTPTTTPTGTTTATPNSCNGTCGSDANCLSPYYVCYQGYCRDKNCLTDTDCTCDATVSPTATATATVIPEELPESGISWPTFLGVSLGTLVILGSILLAL